MTFPVNIPFVDVVGKSQFDATRVFLSHVHHGIAAIGQTGDVGIKDLLGAVRVFKQQFRRCFQRIERFIHVGVIQLGTAFAFAHGEIDHDTVLVGVIDQFRRPGTPQVEFRIRFVDIQHGMRPVYQVVGFHQHKAAVVAPVIQFAGTLPLGVAVPLLFAVNVEVCHGQVKTTVRSAHDVGITDAFLLGDGVAGNHRLSVVDIGEGVPIVTDSKVKPMGVVLEISHQIGR